jgi:hypothetical protein
MIGRRLTILVAVLLLITAADVQQGQSPSNVSRNRTIWAECDCGQGLHHLTVWPAHQPERNFSINRNSSSWIKMDSSITHLSWQCDGSTKSHSLYFPLADGQWFSLLLFNKTKTSRVPHCE